MRPALRLCLTLLVCLSVSVGCQRPAAAEDVSLETEQQKILYSIGLVLSRQLTTLSLEAGDIDYVLAGLEDSARGRDARVDLEVYGPKLQAFAQERAQAAAAAEKEAGTKLVEREAAIEGAVKTDSGMVYRELSAGSGESPAATDTVKVHYRGTLADDTVFDSSYDRGAPAEFPLNQVVPCWTEGVQRMKPGGKSRLICPPELAYGNQGPPGIPGGATLIFEIELLEVAKPPVGG